MGVFFFFLRTGNKSIKVQLSIKDINMLQKDNQHILSVK